MHERDDIHAGILRLLRIFAGVLPCPPGKIRMRAILKESMANYISLENLININFGKNMDFQFFLIPQKNIAKMTAKMTMRHSGKQNTADFCEIWPDHSLDAVKQKCARDF